MTWSAPCSAASGAGVRVSGSWPVGWVYSTELRPRKRVRDALSRFHGDCRSDMARVTQAERRHPVPQAPSRPGSAEPDRVAAVDTHGKAEAFPARPTELAPPVEQILDDVPQSARTALGHRI